MKLIFIGNEEQMHKTDEEKRDYLKIKEKTIGVEFTIKPDIIKAVDTFINELLINNNIEYIKNNCLEAISILNCANLRTVRQCLYNLRLFYMALDKDILEKE
jgi:hypothetical protein